MAVKPLETVLLNPVQAQIMQEDVRSWEGQVQAIQQGHWTQKTIGDVQAIRERIHRTKKQLQMEAASEGEQPTPAERDRLARTEVELREKITQGMLTEEEMRKCPSNAPNDLIKWETANIKDIERWKNVRQQLDPENPEAQNLERFRPKGHEQVRLVDTVIPGKMAYTHVPQEKWDATFDPAAKVETALDQVKKHSFSEAERQRRSEAMKQRWAAKKAASLTDTKETHEHQDISTADAVL